MRLRRTLPRPRHSCRTQLESATAHSTMKRHALLCDRPPNCCRGLTITSLTLSRYLYAIDECWICAPQDGHSTVSSLATADSSSTAGIRACIAAKHLGHAAYLGICSKSVTQNAHEDQSGATPKCVAKTMNYERRRSNRLHQVVHRRFLHHSAWHILIAHALSAQSSSASIAAIAFQHPTKMTHRFA